MNPFARKKWVARSIDPIRDRTNELDQLQAKNANDIKDVDSRATEGINKAMMAANTADQHAADAANRANTAQTTATGASAKTDQLNGTVSNLDQYQQVTSTDVKFANGRTAPALEGKSTLDDMATKLSAEKGYIIEVQGYSKHGVATSQAMADSVVRYLVTEHSGAALSHLSHLPTQYRQVDRQHQQETAIVNGVRVTLLHNSPPPYRPQPRTMLLQRRLDRHNRHRAMARASTSKISPPRGKRFTFPGREGDENSLLPAPPAGNHH